MEFISTIIRLDSTHIHLVKYGRGRPLMLIHGLANNWQGHIPLSLELGKNYQVLIPDLPGYGDSGRLANYNTQIMAWYLYQLITKMAIKLITIAGLSMGGVVAGEFAKTYPDLTKSAIIIGPVLADKGKKVDVAKYFFKSVNVIPKGKSVLKKIVETKSIAYFFAKYVNMYSFNKHLIDEYGMKGKKKMSKEAYVEMAISVAEHDFDTTLKQMTVPTLLLYGREDKISSSIYAKKYILGSNSKLCLAVIAKAGHIVSLEKPEATARAISSFLKAI